MTPLDKKRDWRVFIQGALGIEFSFCGFGFGKDLFHFYIRLGVVTLYVTSRRLDKMIALYREVLAKAKGRG